MVRSFAISAAVLGAAAVGVVDATMPQCSVATVLAGSNEVAALGSAPVLERHNTGQGTACADLCLANEACTDFALDVLATDPVCTLFSGKPTAGKPLAAAEFSGPAIAVGTCREDSVLVDDDMPMLLGLDYFEKGINAINDTINRTKNIRLPVYNFHYDQGKSYFNPFTKIAYKVPDEVSMTINEAGYEEIDSLYSASYTQSVSETTKRYSFQVGIQMNFDNVGAGVTYSDNKQWYNFNAEEHEKNNYLSHSIMWWKFYEVQAYPMEVLGDNAVDPLFKSFLDELPPTISGPNDTHKYNLLLDNWGTHFVTWANFGGQLNLDIFVNSSFDRSETRQWNSDQHSLAFHFNLYDIDPSAQIAGFTNKSQIHVNQSFTNQSRINLYYEGGNPILMTTESLKPWQESIQTQPHWLNVTYKPMSKLPFLDAQTAATLDTFIIDYLKKQLGK